MSETDSAYQGRHREQPADGSGDGTETGNSGVSVEELKEENEEIDEWEKESFPASDPPENY